MGNANFINDVFALAINLGLYYAWRTTHTLNSRQWHN